MRKLLKRPLPEPTATQLENWDREIRNLLSSGQPVTDSLANRYRDPALKRQLVAETCGKCAYCESEITQVYAGDVEHILPKQYRPDLRLSFDNLTLACWQCNHKKSAYYETSLPLLNPYVDDPDDHLVAVGAFIFHAHNDRRGEITRLLLQLDRKELVERRGERLERLHTLAEKFKREPAGMLKNLLEEQLKEEAGEEAEYTFVVRGYLREVCGIYV